MIILDKINSLKKSLHNRTIEIRNLKLWISKKSTNPDFLKDYFIKNNIKKVAIVGSNIYTDILIEELINANLCIEYIIASVWSTNSYGIPVYSSVQDDVDAIVSTSLKKEKYENYNVISLFDILYQK